jgi:hypothetical protein
VSGGRRRIQHVATMDRDFDLAKRQSTFWPQTTRLYNNTCFYMNNNTVTQ